MLTIMFVTNIFCLFFSVLQVWLMGENSHISSEFDNVRISL